ncbi:MAG: beta-ketoacyl-ACP synthase III [Methyloversatilis sp.]|jgi:3-oxoacyl-[acyl-carrier-protein] synthase-3|nr:beta-ketoacyl-ACP synthase III [Methyloversatilis sp.]
MSFCRITGTGGYLPGAPVSNHDLVARGIETSDEWIADRTGIRFRHFAAEHEHSSDLALNAGRKALEMAGREAGEVDLIIVATSTPDQVFPSTACLLQHKLGNRAATAFDVQAVCSGFVYALTIAEKFIRSGSHKCALVVGAEVFSRILDWSDRGTCVLFGDGAGAVVLEASDEPGILSSVLHADGHYHDILSVPGQVCNGAVAGKPLLQMDGQAVFKFAVRVLGDTAIELMQAAELPMTALDWLVPHQANIRILQSTAKRLDMSMDKIVITVAEHGNTSAASVPLALDIAVRDGRIKRGQNVMLEGVGGGFTWGGVLLRF